MLSRTALTEVAFNQLCDALKAEIQELRDVAQQRYHDEAMPASARPLLQRAEQRAQLLEKAEQLKAEWHTSTLVTPTVNLFEQNQSRLRSRKAAMLIRNFKGVTEKVAAECLGLDVKQIRQWLERAPWSVISPLGARGKFRGRKSASSPSAGRPELLILWFL